MFNKLDILGKTFGLLTVINYSHSVYKSSKNGNYYKHYYVCLCSCGNYKIVERSLLTENITKSCGCLAKKSLSSIAKKHGLSETHLYKTWRRMKSRCYDKKAKNYDYYGGRGITVCEKWLCDFVSFYQWALKNGYRKDLSIDRINVDGNYCPENCRWITKKEQSNNRRTNIIIELFGETHTLKQWAEIFEVPYKRLWALFRRKKENLEDVIKQIGEYTEEEWAEKVAQRKAWREEIRELEND